jgi:hypothetical protein
MGTDFDTRKRNKRLNKRAGHEAAAEAGDKAKRDRSKGRPKVSAALSRRLRQAVHAGLDNIPNSRLHRLHATVCSLGACSQCSIVSAHHRQSACAS